MEEKLDWLSSGSLGCAPWTLEECNCADKGNVFVPVVFLMQKLCN